MHDILTTPQSELKQAKQQSQDLHRTSEFFGALLTQEPGEEVPKPPSDQSAEESQTNGLPVSSKVDPMSPFSQPPAPPPQQPLPEKPDIARAYHQDSFTQPPLKRTETERPRLAASSPTKNEPSSQILSLVEALTSAKKEIDSQGDRVKQLEDLLRQERKARESAEERARRLESHQSSRIDRERADDEGNLREGFSERKQERWEAHRGIVDAVEAMDVGEPYQAEQDQPTQSPEAIHKETLAVDASTSRLQQRVDLMVAEMDEMKVHMEQYKRRAERAEEESGATRKTLAEMVESIRAGGQRGIVGVDTSLKPRHQETTSPNSAMDSDTHGNKDLVEEVTAAIRTSVLPNGTLFNTDIKELEHAVATALAKREPGRGGERLQMSAPYASMLGVVLIGVGIMTYLNGWQKVER